MFSLFVSLWLGVMGASAQSNKYDLNHDGDINITDVIELVNYILDKDNGNDGGNENDSIGIVIGESIDLGLPSGVKWASCNIGATKPEEYGGYYAWGETEEKEYYSDSTYVYYQNGAFVYFGDISGTENDVAQVKWGGKWCMPTLDDFKELYNNCINEWTTFKNVNGLKFTSIINGNSIFLPAAGSYRYGVYSADSFGNYWSSTQGIFVNDGANNLYFNSCFSFWDSGKEHRCYGLSVRPVLKE